MGLPLHLCLWHSIASICVLCAAFTLPICPPLYHLLGCFTRHNLGRLLNTIWDAHSPIVHTLSYVCVCVCVPTQLFTEIRDGFRLGLQGLLDAGMKRANEYNYVVENGNLRTILLQQQEHALQQQRQAQETITTLQALVEKQTNELDKMRFPAPNIQEPECVATAAGSEDTNTEKHLNDDGGFGFNRLGFEGFDDIFQDSADSSLPCIEQAVADLLPLDLEQQLGITQVDPESPSS